ncbi:MAG: hypothetical protein QNL04_11940 [SAR324 cluster bacterium]|nr:hypothetical protein [SAR324 cluster bacterium]
MKKLLLILFVCILAFSGCKEEDDETPASHTLNKSGAMHAPGLFQATDNCTSCHGSTLKGSGEKPSCYSCHGQKWD